MKNVTIYCDIDHTLFNLQPFKQQLFQGFANALHCSFQEIEQAYQAYRQPLTKSTDQHLYTWARQLAQEYQVETYALTTVLDNPKLYQSSMYPDVKAFFQTCQDKNITLGIFSEGVFSWQYGKISRSGLAKYIDPSKLVIARRKQDPATLAKLEPHSVVIDDRVDVLESVSSANRKLKLVQMKRANITSETFSGNVVSNLPDLLALLEREQ